MERINCSVCGVTQYLPEHFISARRKSHETFYCPNGHGQCYPDLSENKETLKNDLTKKEEENKKLSAENLNLIHKLEQMEAKHSKEV